MPQQRRDVIHLAFLTRKAHPGKRSTSIPHQRTDLRKTTLVFSLFLFQVGSYILGQNGKQVDRTVKTDVYRRSPSCGSQSPECVLTDTSVPSARCLRITTAERAAAGPMTIPEHATFYYRCGKLHQTKSTVRRSTAQTFAVFVFYVLSDA